MSLVSLSLVVLAAFIHATWNLLSKRAANAGPTFVFAYNLFACNGILFNHESPRRGETFVSRKISRQGME